MPTTLQLDPKDFLKKATAVAAHYGFKSLEDVIKEGKKIKNTKDKIKTKYSPSSRETVRKSFRT